MMTDLERTRTAEQSESAVSRRSLVRGVAVGGLALPLLAACGGGSSSDAAGSSSPNAAAGTHATGGSGRSAGSGGVSIATADVPVGGGTILSADKVVVTQPTKGHFKAFSAICTHMGCPVGSIENGQIVCPCHQSHFSIKDGSVVSGPAPSPLPAKKVAVKGTTVSVS